MIHGVFQSATVQAANPDVFITSALETRIPKKVDYQLEKLALQDLASSMANDPEAILPKLVDLALEVTGAVTGGLSLYEETPAPGAFRWHYLRGTLEAFNGECTPRHYSPCGITLDQCAPVLAQNPETIYDWLVKANISLPEVLLVPLYVGGTVPLGTLWAVSETKGHFDREHARVLTEFASFVDIALHMVRSEQNLRKALEEQEMLAREMNHRVKNLFTVTESLIHMSERSAGSASELAATLLGRLEALQRAHGLVQSRVTSPQTDDPGESELIDLIRTIVQPHEDMADKEAARISIAGESVQCSQHAATAIALILHELATNAAKYGALTVAAGQVDISWRKQDDVLVLRWAESGGPLIDAAPATPGFGTTLVSNAVARQLDGTLHYDWQPSGLVLQMDISLKMLAG